MSNVTDTAVTDGGELERLLERLERAVERLAETRPFAKNEFRGRVLDTAHRVLIAPGGAAAVLERIERIDAAGTFADSDWAVPARLQPRAVSITLAGGDTRLVTLECLSELRWLKIAMGDYLYQDVSSEHALHFLREVLALNLDYVFHRQTEAARNPRLAGVYAVFQLIVDRIGYGDILEQLVEEVWRVLRQRPIKLDGIKEMVTQLSVFLTDATATSGGTPRGTERLVSALYGPSTASQEDPGLEIYQQRVEAMDPQTLQQEAAAFARAMHDTGLVSVYHPVLLRFLSIRSPQLIATALGLSSTGTDALLSYHELVAALIDEAIFPETSQSVYGLACLLERGILYHPPLAPALWRQIGLRLNSDVQQAIRVAFGAARAPRVHLLGGVLSLLGQPLGVGQGQNPTCQSARALSMWAWNDPDYLLQLLTWAARDNEVIMHFEGQAISSAGLPGGLVENLNTDLDPVSLVLVPHLDRIYNEMGRLAAIPGEDPHRRINPEFHGWWVGRGFAIAVTIDSGKLQNFEEFIRRFYAVYHPYYNGNKPVIYPQPAGIAVTDSRGRFVGWHAITILRVALDPERQMRLYFFNPNNDSGQDWGCGIVVSTEGHGEFFGEASLPIHQFTSRLYIYHYDPLEIGDPAGVPAEEITDIIQMATASWAVDRQA